MPLFEKLFDLGDDIKQKVGSAITSTVSNGVATLDTFIDENIPGGEQFTDNYAQGVKNIGEGIQDNLDYADQKANDGFTNVGQIPYWAVGHFIKSQEQYRSNAKTLAKSAGIDERAGDLLTDVATDIAMTGAGAGVKGISNLNLPTPPQAQLVTAGGIAGYRPPLNLPQKGGDVLNLTIKDKSLLAPGIVEGVGSSDTYRKAVKELRKQQEFVKQRRIIVDKEFAYGLINEKQYKEKLAKIKKRSDAKFSTLATDEDPAIFERSKYQNEDPTGYGRVADQHHASAKSMTTPWVKKALELGDDDDVVGLFEFHRMLTGSGMGNARSGIIDVPSPAHVGSKAKKAGFDPKDSIHSRMKSEGLEIRTDKVLEILGKPKDMDELLTNYAAFAKQYLIPQKEFSLKKLDSFLKQHRSKLKPSEQKTFDALVQKLNKANT